MPNNTNTGSKKTYTASDIVNMNQQAYDAVDEQAILDKYNQATAAQFAAQQNQNMIAENNFYNQMYNTQRTAMDTIRQSNANAVSTGASRGMQAANELSALLGLQQESIASATELANARRQTAQEETAAMLQNIVQASQDAANQRQQAMQSMIQAQSLVTDQETAAKQQETANVQLKQDATMTSVREHNPTYLIQAVEATGELTDFRDNPSIAGVTFIDTAFSSLKTPDWDNYVEMLNTNSTDVAHNMLRKDAQYITMIAKEMGVYDDALQTEIDSWLESALHDTDLTSSAYSVGPSAWTKSRSWLDKINKVDSGFNKLKTMIKESYQNRISKS